MVRDLAESKSRHSKCSSNGDGWAAIPTAAACAARAGVASRTNVLLSIPMLFFMAAARHLLYGVSAQSMIGVYWTLVFITVGAIEVNALYGKTGPMTTIKGVIHCGSHSLRFSMRSSFLQCSLILMIATGCTKNAPEAPPNPQVELINRGRIVYQTNCTACHAPNPTMAGALGRKSQNPLSN